MSRGELLGDLEAGVSPTDDEHSAFGNVARPAVARAVGLPDAGFQALCDLGDVRALERARGDDDLVAVTVRPSISRTKRPSDWESLRTSLFSSTGSSKLSRVALQVSDHLVARRIAVRNAGKGRPGSAL
jgi:hypothetical protein